MRTIITAILLFLTAPTVSNDAPNVANLLQSGLAHSDSHEVIMSRVSVPAGSSIPYHFHPTEEFLYVVSGSVYLKIKGQEDKLLKAGTAHKIPAKEVHSAATKDEPSEIIVFRVHPKGQPVVLSPEG